MQNTNTHPQEGPAVDVGSGALLGRIDAKITELEAEYKKENDEMHRLYNEWPEGSRGAQQRMFYAGAKLALLKGLLCPNNVDVERGGLKTP